MDDKKTIEGLVADTLLQNSKTVEVNSCIYDVAPASTATIILVSKCISRIPDFDMDKTDVLGTSLRIGKDCRFLGEVAAIMILGATNLTEKKTIYKTKLWGLIKYEEEQIVNRKEELTNDLLLYKTPKQLYSICADLFSSMEFGDFFGLTAFLRGINLIKPTRKAEQETTAFGQSSQES